MFFVAPLPRFKKAPAIPEILTNDSEVTKMLIRAKNLLDGSGWLKGSYGMDGEYCAIGALNQTVFGSPVSYSHFSPYTNAEKVSDEARNFLVQSLPFGWKRITPFNDAWWRRKSRVLKLYDDAIAKSRNAK